jgi:hypothetical protein
MNRYEDDARREIEQKETFRRWIQARVDTIHSRVSAADILSRYSVKLRYGGQKPEQMFCPFHGNKRTMAARYHPKDVRNTDHVWCFVCCDKGPWDCIELFRRFENLTGDRFSAVLRHLERAYGIIPPDTPPVVDDEPDDSERIEIEAQFDTCDFRLRNARNAFEMKSYLTVGSIIDRLHWAYENGKVEAPTVRDTLRRVLDKIGVKVRACPGD